MSIQTLVPLMQAVARTSLGVAWLAALVLDAAPEAPLAPQRSVIAAPAAAPLAAPAPEQVVVEAPLAQGVVEAPAMTAPRPSKCGDLPRAPWNTCVALHDHEI